MSATKETDLVTAVMLYAMRCFAEGDLYALQEMNFGPKELGALRDISVGDLVRARELTAHCLRIHLNREVYWPMLEHLHRERASDALQQELMQGDAPLEMMQSLFAISAHEYTRQRRMLTVNPALGRTPEADEAQSHELWAAWQALEEDTGTDLAPAIYLRLHQATGISLRIIWNLTQRWQSYGAVELEDIGGAA